MKKLKLFPWVRKFWESLDDDSKEVIVRSANTICKYALNDGARARVIGEVQSLCDRFEVIANDCQDVISDPDFKDLDTVPSSSLQFLVNYFEQFKDLMIVRKQAEVLPAGSKKYRLKNDYWGILEGVVIKETAGRYYFQCYKDGSVVMESWALSKDSNRILEEVK